jgi:phage terminase large subunit
LFVEEVLNTTPDDWQIVILRAFGKAHSGLYPEAELHRKVVVQSCHGPGKTAVAAWITVIQQVLRHPQKTAATAPTGGQMYDAYYAEVKRWMRALPAELYSLFEIMSDRIELKGDEENSFLSARTAKPEQPEALQGVHRDDGFVLLVADEGSGIAEQIFESAGGSMSGKNVFFILLSNPVRTSGFFYNACNKTPGWLVIRVSALPEDHAPEKGVYYSKRPGARFAQEMANEYGVDSNAYRVRVRGLFPKSDSDTIIAFELVEGAKKRDVKASPTAAIVWGLDCARGGGDRNVLVKRQANVMLAAPRVLPETRDLMQVVGWVKKAWDDTRTLDRPVEICVDAIGIGAGVCDRLRELGLPARAVNVSESPAITGDRYKNLRTELWFLADQWFRQRDCLIIDDEKGEFSNELVAQKYKLLDSGGKTIALPKDDMRKLLRGKSPDLADAFILTFASTATAALYGGWGNWNTPLKRNLPGVV